MEINKLNIKFLALFFFFFFAFNSFSQGKFSGEFNTIIGQKFLTEKDIPQLDSFKYVGGSIISDCVDCYFLKLEVFKKGTTAIVVLSKLVDKVNRKYSIIEVLKISDVPKNYEIRISGCTSKNIIPDDKIIAVYYIGSKKNVKLIKESYILKDIRFEKMNPKTVKCFDEIEID